MTKSQSNAEVRVDASEMINLITQIFDQAGCDPVEAQRIGVRLTGANLRGHDSHGVIRTPRYVEWMEAGRVVPNTSVSIEQETDTYAVVNGNYGFGQTVGEEAVDIGIDKAKQSSVAVIALKNAGHLGRIGDWAERAAASNMASIHMVNVRGSLLVAPFGGVDRRGSTSPFCMGVPLDGGTSSIILDFATSLVAEGKALVALRGGKALPEGALVSQSGELTNDPSPLYGEVSPDSYPDPNKGPGALTGFGLHKGSGLNFFMEMMAGALTGSGTSAGASDAERRRFCNGMLSIFMSVDAFQESDWFTKEIQDYVAFYKSARPVGNAGEVLIPGEKEIQTMQVRKQDGLPLPEQTWADILGAARHVGINDQALAAVVSAPLL